MVSFCMLVHLMIIYPLSFLQGLCMPPLECYFHQIIESTLNSISVGGKKGLITFTKKQPLGSTVLSTMYQHQNKKYKKYVKLCLDGSICIPFIANRIQYWHLPSEHWEEKTDYPQENQTICNRLVDMLLQSYLIISSSNLGLNLTLRSYCNSNHHSATCHRSKDIINSLYQHNCEKDCKLAQYTYSRLFRYVHCQRLGIVINWMGTVCKTKIS